MTNALEREMTANTTRPTWNFGAGWSDGWTMPTGLRALETDDYQKRGDGYPKSNVPDSIRAYRGDHGNDAMLEFQFKNTSQRTGEAWVTRYCADKKLKVTRVTSAQAGDYHDDWINVHATISVDGKKATKRVTKKETPKATVLPPVVKATPEAGANEQRKVAKKLVISSINNLLRNADSSITFKSGSTTSNRLLAYNNHKYMSSMMPDTAEQFLREAGVNDMTLQLIRDVLKTIA